MTWHPDMPDEYKNAIVTGDARELAKRIPDESIDLIFTDPPYPKEYLCLYEWLASVSERILVKGGLCLAMAGQSYLPDIYKTMCVYLSYHWTFNLPTPGPSVPIWTRRINSNWKPILSFSKGEYDGPWLKNDVFSSGARDKRFHAWGQHEQSAIWIITKFSGNVFDPFAGGGTIPAVCKGLNRNYIAFEIDPDTAELARERVRNTQPPLFVMEPEQLEFDNG